MFSRSNKRDYVIWSIDLHKYIMLFYRSNLFKDFRGGPLLFMEKKILFFQEARMCLSNNTLFSRGRPCVFVKHMLSSPCTPSYPLFFYLTTVIFIRQEAREIKKLKEIKLSKK